MKIKFSKMHGLGNDFMIINNLDNQLKLNSSLIQQWADRHTGIGFDQLLLLEKAKNNQADYFYRIYNSDGSESSQCGNGARCVAKYLYDNQLTQKNPICFETNAGLLWVKHDKNDLFTVNMGIPNFIPQKIPFITLKEELTYDLIIEDKPLQIQALSIGNPHCIIYVEHLENYPVKELGTIITSHPQFPEQTNVEFVQLTSPETILLRVYERGAGETLACGSGACAAVVAGRALGKLTETVAVKLPGGTLTVKWAGPEKEVMLTGPATFVYSSEIIN